MDSIERGKNLMQSNKTSMENVVKREFFDEKVDNKSINRNLGKGKQLPCLAFMAF